MKKFLLTLLISAPVFILWTICLYALTTHPSNNTLAATVIVGMLAGIASFINIDEYQASLGTQLRFSLSALVFLVIAAYIGRFYYLPSVDGNGINIALLGVTIPSLISGICAAFLFRSHF